MTSGIGPQDPKSTPIGAVLWSTPWPAEKDFFNFLYGLAKPVPYEALPEDTSLRRNVKRMLLEGRILHSAAGVLKEDLP